MLPKWRTRDWRAKSQSRTPRPFMEMLGLTTLRILLRVHDTFWLRSQTLAINNLVVFLASSRHVTPTKWCQFKFSQGLSKQTKNRLLRRFSGTSKRKGKSFLQKTLLSTSCNEWGSKLLLALEVDDKLVLITRNGKNLSWSACCVAMNDESNLKQMGKSFTVDIAFIPDQERKDFLVPLEVDDKQEEWMF